MKVELVKVDDYGKYTNKVISREAIEAYLNKSDNALPLFSKISNDSTNAIEPIGFIRNLRVEGDFLVGDLELLENSLNTSTQFGISSVGGVN